MQHWGERGDNRERFLAYLNGREHRLRMSGDEWFAIVICVLVCLMCAGLVAVTVFATD